MGGAQSTPTGHLLMAIHDELLGYYGPQQWWPTRTGSMWEIMLGAVLTQHTSWTNVELSLSNMEAIWGLEGLRQPDVVLNAPLEAVTAAVRPAGFHTQKPERLKTLARFVASRGGADALLASPQATAQLRTELLALKGVGPETADAILLYALNRPMFVADAYAVRLCARWGLAAPTAGYHAVQALFMDNLPHDAALFNEYHALIVSHAKDLCRPRPLCDQCPLNRTLSIGVEGMSGWNCPKLYTVPPTKVEG
jgi:endonuclease-3 related protein